MRVWSTYLHHMPGSFDELGHGIQTLNVRIQDSVMFAGSELSSRQAIYMYLKVINDINEL